VAGVVISVAGAAIAANTDVVRLKSAGATSRFQEESNHTLTVASNWPVVDLDPHGGYDPGSGQAMTGPFESLIKLRPGTSSEFEPSLAESWTSNEDQSRWTFRLRPDLTFHNGSPVDAEAVRASFERLFALALAPSTVLGRFIEHVDQIQVEDELTIVFDLGRPQRLFETAMAAPYGTAIVNAALAKQHEVDGDWGHGWAQTDGDGLGTGPYRVTSFDQADRLVMERFDNYWGGWSGEHFDQIVVRLVTEAETRRQLIEQGDADIVQNIALDAIDDLEVNPDITVDRQPNLIVRYLAMTMAEPLLSWEARQALCYAFPYTEVLEGAFLGYAKPARGPVNERCYGFAPTAMTYSTDLAKARELLDQAGVQQGTTISVANPAGNPLVQTIAELFQANLAQIGVNLKIVNLDNVAYAEMVFGDMPAGERVNLFPGAWGPDYDDAYNHLWPLLSCDAWHAGNAGRFCSDRVDELLLNARISPDEHAYLDAMAEVQRIVTEEDPSGIYFAQPEWISVLRADVGGYQMNPVGSGLFDYYSLYRVST
jgi:peptide/nickel transport system substrate-binding protein